jgi:hypothetical protein
MIIDKFQCFSRVHMWPYRSKHGGNSSDIFLEGVWPDILAATATQMFNNIGVYQFNIWSSVFLLPLWPPRSMPPFYVFPLRFSGTVRLVYNYPLFVLGLSPSLVLLPTQQSNMHLILILTLLAILKIDPSLITHKFCVSYRRSTLIYH